MQGVRGCEHLPAPAPKEPMQGVRGGEHLPAPARKEPMQGVRGGEHLRAPGPEEPIQGVREHEHLPASASNEPMQGVVGSQAHGRRRSDHGVASLVSGDAGGASGTHRTIATVGVPTSQLCTAAAAATLLVLEGMSEQQRTESPVHAPLGVSVIVHASAEMEHPIAVAAHLSASIADPGTGRCAYRPSVTS
jgi:hypothetical protein